MPELSVNGVAIDDTFAEAFGMRATAIVITGPNRKWARQAAITMSGFATSVIACGCEAAIDVELPESETPDGRPGCRVMLFAVSTDELQKQLLNRVGQCVLTCPGTACFAGISGEEQIKLGADWIKITATGGVLSVAREGHRPQFSEEEIRTIVFTPARTARSSRRPRTRS
jgi:formylmethanofuran--tetrahydromethanopterin N-formyltransferase